MDSYRGRFPTETNEKKLGFPLEWERHFGRKVCKTRLRTRFLQWGQKTLQDPTNSHTFFPIGTLFTDAYFLD